jgi:hypothetical protein
MPRAGFNPARNVDAGGSNVIKSGHAAHVLSLKLVVSMGLLQESIIRVIHYKCRKLFTNLFPVPADNASSTQIHSAAEEVHLSVYPSVLLGNDLEPINLTKLHPSLAQTWMLWHVFVENVDPLFKIFHAPSLQKQILSAAQDIDSIDGDLETLLFAVYFAATVVQDDAECVSKYKQPKMDLLQRWELNSKCRRNMMIIDRDLDTGMPLSSLSLAPNL